MYHSKKSPKPKAAQNLIKFLPQSIDDLIHQIKTGTLEDIKQLVDDIKSNDILDAKNPDQYLELESRDYNGDSCLHAVVNSMATNRAEIFEFLLRQGVNPQLKNNKGLTALEYAKSIGKDDVVASLDKLLKDPEITKLRKHWEFIAELQTGDMVIDKFIDPIQAKEIDVNFQNENFVTPLIAVVNLGRLLLVKLLLDFDADPNISNLGSGMTALQTAYAFVRSDRNNPEDIQEAKIRAIQICAELIDKKANIDAVTKVKGENRSFNLLAKAIEDVDSPIYSERAIDFVKFLLARGASIVKVNDKNETALEYALRGYQSIQSSKYRRDMETVLRTIIFSDETCTQLRNNIDADLLPKLIKFGWFTISNDVYKKVDMTIRTNKGNSALDEAVLAGASETTQKLYTHMMTKRTELVNLDPESTEVTKLDEIIEKAKKHAEKSSIGSLRKIFSNKKTQVAKADNNQSAKSVAKSKPKSKPKAKQQPSSTQNNSRIGLDSRRLSYVLHEMPKTISDETSDGGKKPSDQEEDDKGFITVGPGQKTKKFNRFDYFTDETNAAKDTVKAAEQGATETTSTQKILAATTTNNNSSNGEVVVAPESASQYANPIGANMGSVVLARPIVINPLRFYYFVPVYVVVQPPPSPQIEKILQSIDSILKFSHEYGDVYYRDLFAKSIVRQGRVNHLKVLDDALTALTTVPNLKVNSEQEKFIHNMMRILPRIRSMAGYVTDYNDEVSNLFKDLTRELSELRKTYPQPNTLLESNSPSNQAQIINSMM